MLGLLLGLAIVIGFVFFGSGETIDAPSLPDVEQQRTTSPEPGPGSQGP